VVQDLELLVEAVADGALTDDRQLRVDIDRAGSRHEEEVRLEVVEVVGGERIQTVSVHGENPLREKTRVE
jgi:hypothetical protein